MDVTRNYGRGRAPGSNKGLDFVTESRSSTRHPVNIDVTVTHEEITTEQTMLNMSLGGALLTFSERLPLGDNIEVTFRIPTQEAPISVKAVVRWSTDESAGVQFDGLRAREVWSLNEFFKQFTP